ncbi:MAG: biopolymer transporter ExbD [Lentimicrobiaceae bacterium]
MPKAKIPRKSTWVDMTAMCDVAFLLLNFFMLTSNFVKKEPVLVSTPSSVSEIKIPETNVMTMLIDKEGKVYFGIDGQEKRKELLKMMGDTYKISFTPEELKAYSVIDLVGNPIESLSSYLHLNAEVRDLPQNNPGIPSDSINNQLTEWVKAARMVNPDIRIAIKADAATPYPVVKKVMKTLQHLDENRYNLITQLEGEPSN